MALQSSGPISVGDINDEIGESTDSTLDLQTAAQKFPDILDDDAVSMDEFYGLTFSAGVGTYGTRNSHAFRFVAGSPNRGFADGELVSAAENSTTDLSGASLTGQSDFVDDFIDNDLTNGDTIFANSTGATKTNLRPGGDFASGTHFLLDTTANKIGQVDSNGDVSNVRSRTPDTLTISETSKNSNSITISIVGNTQVTRLLAPFRDGVELTNVAPSDSGNLSNTNTTTSYTYTGLSSGTTYALKVRGENTFANGADSNTLNITTDSTRTGITVQYLHFNPAAEEDAETNNGWPDGELVLCAENSTTALDEIIEQGTWTSTTANEFIDDSTISDGDIVFAGSIGSTLTPLRNYQNGYFVETTQNVIFDLVTATAAVTGKRSRTPDIPTKPTLVADSSTQITVTIPTTNTQVTRTFKLQRSINSGAYSDLATIVPSASGSVANTSVNTTYVDSTGISAGDVVKYKVRGQNNFNNSDFSTESNTVTTPSAGTSISYSNVASIAGIGISDPPNESFFDEGVTPMSVAITNGSGTTSISKSDTISSTTRFAWSTSGDPMDISSGTTDTTATSNGGSGWVSSATGISGTPIYLRIRADEATRTINESGTMTLSTTNNSVTENQACNISINNF
jgi:hypothetical protein